MIDQLESDLRDALTQRAGEVPGHAVARLRQVDYHPRTSRVRPRLALGALAGATGTAGVVVSIVGLGAGAQAAFAGWTPTPTQASSTQIAAAEASCESQLAANTTPPFSTAKITGWRPVLTDTRGPFTYLILQSGNYSAACFSSPSFTGYTGNAFTLDSGVPAGTVQLQSSGLQLLGPDGQRYTGEGPDGSAYRLIEGFTGPGVTAVTLLLSDGTRVEATTANSWFAAWWPGTATATSADVTTATGITAQQLPVQPPAAICLAQSGSPDCAGATGRTNTGGTGHTGPTAATGAT